MGTFSFEFEFEGALRARGMRRGCAAEGSEMRDEGRGMRVER
jgi:hypothetical protein